MTGKGDTPQRKQTLSSEEIFRKTLDGADRGNSDRIPLEVLVDGDSAVGAAGAGVPVESCPRGEDPVLAVKPGAEPCLMLKQTNTITQPRGDTRDATKSTQQKRRRGKERTGGGGQRGAEKVSAIRRRRRRGRRRSNSEDLQMSHR